MGQDQSRRTEVAAFSDPFAGEPLRGEANAPDVFSDPYAGEPLRMGSKGANLPEMRPVASHESAQPTWADRLGLNEPTDSMLGGFLRGAGAGAVDLTQGAVSNVVGQLNAKTRAENAIIEADRLPWARTRSTLPDVESPGNFSGKVGEALPMVAEMTIGGGVPARQALNAIPRTARAGQKFQEVMGAARNIPIETKGVGDAALRIQQLADRGAPMPLAVRKLLVRMTDPNKAAMTYEESRDFASNISRLSVAEKTRLTHVVRRAVAALSAELNLANAQAAQKAGKMAEYKSAMREYAQAMRLKEMAENALKAAKKIAPWATAAGAAEYLTRDMRR